MESNRYNATWWNKDNDSAWDNVKGAFRRDWEQQRTQPTGPARALLRIVASNPKAIEALHE